ncbi:LysR family transcriptional regulator [Ectothiorhodospiraceae bacterium WFHF3C12]|nr:LysR family transcriptional regulator [Ectothiorhodospiraceae bacterium WFHF3C12]
MEIGYLYFAEVARFGSIRQAAERLHVSASSVSRQIVKLEHELGTPLISRHAQGIKLTEAGVIVAEYVQSHSREFQRLKAAIDDLRDLQQGHVIVFTVEGMLGGALPRALAHFSATYPALTYEVYVSGADDVMQAVARDRCDIGISFNPNPRNEVEAVARFSQPVLAVMGPEHPLAGSSQLSLGDLLSTRVAVPDKVFGIRHIVDQAAKEEDVSLPVALETNSIDMLRQFALYGLGVTFMPAFAFERELSAGKLVGVPLHHRLMRTATTQICKHRDLALTFSARALARVLVESFGPERCDFRTI